jgi:leishmanolysin
VYGYSKVLTKTTISGPNGSETFFVFMLPEVRDYARQYYNCPNLIGVPLENNGGSGSAGSHWEKLFHPIEYMNPQVEYPAIISEFTMALLRSSGWYKTAPDSAQRYDWGKGAGCGFFSICPTAQPGYCSAEYNQQRYCTSEYMSKGTCLADSYFSSGCRIISTDAQSCIVDTGAATDTGEVYGPNSRCIMWTAVASGRTVTRPRCQRVVCNGDGTLSIMYGSGVTLQCTGDFQTIQVPNESYTLNCPNIENFCSEYNARCPNDCNARGICLSSRRCSCFDGYSGEDCSSSTPMPPTRFALERIVQLGSQPNLGGHLQDKTGFIAVLSFFILQFSLLFV